MSILASLTPSESKRLIAMAVAVHPAVKKAMESGRILISGGTTTGFVVEELLHEKIEISHFPSGVSTGGVLCHTSDAKIRPYMIVDGTHQPSDPALPLLQESQQFIADMKYGDVYIKGANAIDGQGNAGFLLANPMGGHVMAALHKVNAMGVSFIIPVGLEKLIYSVPAAHRAMKGRDAYTYTFGHGCGYATVPNGIIIHEIEALRLLTGVDAVLVGAGGVGGSEGAIHLSMEGTDEAEKATFELIKKIKREPAIPFWKQNCKDCTFKCKYIFGDRKI